MTKMSLGTGIATLALIIGEAVHTVKLSHTRQAIFMKVKLQRILATWLSIQARFTGGF